MLKQYSTGNILKNNNTKTLEHLGPCSVLGAGGRALPQDWGEGGGPYFRFYEVGRYAKVMYCFLSKLPLFQEQVLVWSWVCMKKLSHGVTKDWQYPCITFLFSLSADIITLKRRKPWTLKIFLECLLCFDQSHARPCNRRRRGGILGVQEYTSLLLVISLLNQSER